MKQTAEKKISQTMAKPDGQPNPPENWDDDVNGSGDANSVDDINTPLANLNVNAAVFVPGQNVFAPTFVPTFSKSENGEGVGENEESSSPDQTPHVPAEPSEIGNGKEELRPLDDDNPKQELPPLDIDKMDTDETSSDKKSPDEDGSVADDWADNADEGSRGSGTPEDDSDEAMETDASSDAGAARPKKKKNVDIGPPKEKKEHVNVVFIGHVDAGKSTIGGHIMYLTGKVDKRTLEKYEREAKEKNRETWYLSWALDTNTEERDKGKTVEVGRAYFETEKKHFTILDAPGHKSFVPNMIGGACQADLAVLVISARKGEFEAGLERGGQTREHAMLAKTAGVRYLVVLINKMDDPTVMWDENRYNECRDKLIPELRRFGFNPKTDFCFMPVSGYTGAFLMEPADETTCPWYRGPCLIEYLDAMPSLLRSSDGPIRLPIIDKYRDMGTIILGKVESGIITKNQIIQLMPNKSMAEVMQLWSDDDEVESANPGENVKVKLKGIEDEDVSPGFVLCPPENPCNTGRIFDAQIVILEHKSIICAGYSAVLHIHACAEEVTIKSLLCLVDKKTGERNVLRPRFVKQDQVAIARIEVNGGMICLEVFKEFPQMGRFTLRDEGKTIAIGKVLKIRE